MTRGSIHSHARDRRPSVRPPLPPFCPVSARPYTPSPLRRTLRGPAHCSPRPCAAVRPCNLVLIQLAYGGRGGAGGGASLRRPTPSRHAGPRGQVGASEAGVEFPGSIPGSNPNLCGGVVTSQAVRSCRIKAETCGRTGTSFVPSFCGNCFRAECSTPRREFPHPGHTAI